MKKEGFCGKIICRGISPLVAGSSPTSGPDCLWLGIKSGQLRRNGFAEAPAQNKNPVNKIIKCLHN